MDWTVLLIGFAKYADQLADLLRKLRGEKIRRNNEAAAYFEQLSSAMEKVVEGLRANRIPRIDGNEMQTLIHDFEKKTHGVLSGDESAALKASLDNAAATAGTLDGWLLLNQPQDEIDRNQMLALIERITGHCRGLAGALKSPA